MTKNTIFKTYQDESPEREQYTSLFTPRNKKKVQRPIKQATKQNHAWFYLGLVGNIGYTIAIPIAGGAIIGSLVDRQWSLYPKATLACLFIGIVVSMYGFASIVKRIINNEI